MDWLQRPPPSPCRRSYQQALARQETLTKPQGSLGRLETMALHLAALQSTPHPSIDKVWISVFAADHGVANERVS
ncbi:MAG TPA: nicotinate-nucleotide--dimethylbenzimidazole phosphoribosyltransferase, partial [Gammaproteobacteria bacterium]|nr:nicotinate-nucleotide--dimethylbenzimidazole phosphoribosyltransferase [Gammaproteobacteria bacterium]